MIKNFIFLLFNISLFLLLFQGKLISQILQASTNEPVEVTAGKTTYKWEIERLILENTNNQIPLIVQGEASLKANTIIYDNKKEMGYAFGDIFYQNKKEQVILTAGEGTYNTKTKELIVKQNPKIISKKDNTTARSTLMKIYPERDYIVMIGNVKITNTNYTIEGDQAIYYHRDGQFKILGKAKTIQEKTTLKADKIVVSSKSGNLESYTATGDVQVEDSKEGYTIKSGRLDYFKELGYSKITQNPVILFKDKNIEAYAITMEKYDNEEKANLLGNVIIVQEKKRAYAKWGEYFIKTKKMALSGNPMLVEGRSMFSANKILIDVDSETMSMIGRGSGLYEYETK